MVSKSVRSVKVSFWDKGSLVGFVAAIGSLVTGLLFLVKAEWATSTLTKYVFFGMAPVLLALVAALTSIRAVHTEFGEKSKKKSRPSSSSND